MTLKILQNARKNLAAGITTVRDLGGWNELEFAVRRSVRRNDFERGAHDAGRTLHLHQRIGGRLLRGHVPHRRRCGSSAQSHTRTNQEWRRPRQVGGHGRGAGARWPARSNTFNPDEIRVAVEEAAKFGKGVAAHAHGIDGIRKAVQAGVHSIEHGTFLYQGPDVIEEMKQRGTYLVPTLKPGWDVVNGDRSNIPQWIVDKMIETQDAAIQSLRLACQAGVPIAMGSDAGTPLNFHGENGLEVYWMQQAGMKPMDALFAATLGAAKALGWNDRVGSVEEGKYADLLICDENPLDDLKRLANKKNLRAVFLGGKLTARQATNFYPVSILAHDLLTIDCMPG